MILFLRNGSESQSNELGESPNKLKIDGLLFRDHTLSDPDVSLIKKRTRTVLAISDRPQAEMINING